VLGFYPAFFICVNCFYNSFPIFVFTMTTSTLLIIGIVLCLLFIAFFAGYEIAFISANRLSIELKKKQGKRSGIIISKFMERPAHFIGTGLIGLNIFLVCYGLLFDGLLKISLWNRIQNEYLRLIFDTLFSALILIIFGLFFPKAIFRAKADRLLRFFASTANFFYQMLLPITDFFVGIAHWILKYIFNLKMGDKKNAFNKVDLQHFFQPAKEQEEKKSDLNTDLFENALSLPSIKIRQCLVPRTEIEAIEIGTTIEDASKLFTSTRLSKLIVYKTNIDNIAGYIHQLDLFKKPASINEIIHPIPVVPETMGVTDLINKFTKEQKSIAWVVDEFGGTAGIITMEDLLEEIFGEIQDEYDTEEFVDKQIAEDEFIFSGRLELDYIMGKYDLEFSVQESETLSGYIINQFETIPKQGEIIIIENYQFNILTVTETRIDMVKLKLLR